MQRRNIGQGLIEYALILGLILLIPTCLCVVPALIVNKTIPPSASADWLHKWVLVERSAIPAPTQALRDWRTMGGIAISVIYLIHLAAYTIVPRAFYAMQNTLFPAVYGSIAVLLSIPFYFFGLRFFGSKGIALAISLSGILQVLVLYMLWNKRSSNRGSRQVYIFYAKLICFSALLFPLLSWFKTNVLAAVNPATFAGSVLVIILTAAAFTAIMGLVAYGLKVREITDVAAKIGAHLKRVIYPQQ